LDKTELEKAWEELQKRCPREVEELPNPDERPEDEESLDALMESGVQFEPPDWAMIQEGLLKGIEWKEADARLAKWRDTLEEPDRTIWEMYQAGKTQQQISRAANREQSVICRRLAVLRERARAFLCDGQK